MSIVKSQEGIALSKPALQYMAGLINKIANLDTNLIDDINLKSNGSFSSVHVTELIDECLQKANSYAEVLCNALTKLTAEKTTTLPTLDNSEKNVIYLYSSNGSAPFEQYLKISDTELIDMGSTTISLTDYLTATEIARDYCSKVDFNTLTSEVTTVKSDVTTHTSDTDIHITSAERTKWNEIDNKVNKTDIINNLISTDTDKPLSANQGKVLKDEIDLKANDSEVVKKTDITTSINSSSTNTQMPSAKTVYNLVGNENRRGYVFNNPTYRGNKWNRVFKVNSLLYCNSGFLTVVVYSSGLCQIASFLISKNFNRLNIKQINCGGYNGAEGKSRPIKVRIIGNETSNISFLEIYVSGTTSTNVITTYMPLHCNSVEVLNEEGSIPDGMFACEMTSTHDTYDTATYTSVLK